ncbi:MAG TPA: pitrilysin family protein [Longimicrobiales bacterium]|nr:pitrilysin family protein [Longimicrobiales bacterium]
MSWHRERRAGLVAAAALAVAAAVAPSPALAQVEPPPPLPASPIRFPEFREYRLENGLRVAVVSYGTQPVVSARLYVRGGWSADPPAQAGLAALAATVLTRGTANRTAPEIAALIEGVGGSISANAGQEFFNVGTVSLTEDVELAFDLLSDVVRNVTFPEDEVELARRQILSSLQAELGEADVVASKTFDTVLYGSDHPYGLNATPATVQAISRDDLLAFRDRVLVPNGGLLLVAGQVDPDRVAALARQYFGDWSGGQPFAPVVPEPAPRTSRDVYLVHRPGSVQSVVMVGDLGIAADNPDYFPLLVLNQVLGGSEGRLEDVLREERGWTYYAYSTFNRPTRRGYFLAQTESRTEVTDSTVAEILEQFRRLRDETVPEAELEEAKAFLAGSFPLRLETADQVASQLAGSLLLGLPIEDVTEYPERIRAVTGDDVRRVAREYIDPDRVAVIVVGDATILLDRLRALGTIHLLDVEGNPLSPESLGSQLAP